MPSLLDAEKGYMIGTTLLWIAAIILVLYTLIGSLYVLKEGPWALRFIVIAAYAYFIGMYLVEQGI